MRILMLPGSQISPPARFRFLQYLEPLKKMGHQVEVRVTSPAREWHSLIPGLAGQIHSRIGALLRVLSALWITADSDRFDIVLMQRDLVPNTSVTFIEPWLYNKRKNLVFDFDDAIFLGPRDRKLQRILPMFSLVIAGNAYLADYARQYNNHVLIVPTIVDTDRYTPEPVKASRPLCIGWTGSSSTVELHLPGIWLVLEELVIKHDFEFLVVADKHPQHVPSSIKMRFLPWSPENEVVALKQMHIGLMPLTAGPQSEGKCGAKLVSYGAMGIPSVASAVGANNEIILHGKTGFLCRNPEEWNQHLGRLIEDEGTRVELGQNARQRIVRHYSLAAWAPVLSASLEQAASIGRA